jgi:hypothetical protein
MSEPVDREPPEIMLSRVAVLYEAMLEESGINAGGVGWSSDRVMDTPFELFAEMLAGETGPVSVNDLGCGWGALFDHLQDLPVFAQGIYIGYDISEAMVAAARRRVGDPRARFEQAASPLVRADYSLASGTFNIRFGAALADWDGLVRDSIRILAQASRKGFAFNLLGTRPVEVDPDMFYADPADFTAFCRAEFGQRVETILDYVPNQFMIRVRLD